MTKKKHATVKAQAIPEDSSYVANTDTPQYLRGILSRFCGYSFITLDKPQKGFSTIKVHKTVPVMQQDGQYISPSMQNVRLVCISNPEFEGMVMDRNEHVMFGNPFKSIRDVQNNVPTIGKQDEQVTYDAETI